VSIACNLQLQREEQLHLENNLGVDLWLRLPIERHVRIENLRTENPAWHAFTVSLTWPPKNFQAAVQTLAKVLGHTALGFC